MASSGRKRAGGGGVKNQAISAVVLLVLVAAIISWARVNEIKDPVDAFLYFRSWSDKASECYRGEKLWNCDAKLNPIKPPVIGTPDAPGGPTDGVSPKPEPITPGSDKNVLQAALDKVSLADVLPEDHQTKYVAAEWPHWVGAPCDARQATLRAKGTDVVLLEGSKCVVKSGKWTDQFTETEITDPAALDIAYSITPQYAADHGGSEWSAEMKTKFANDTSQLEVITPEERLKKASQDPSDYMPGNRAFQCSYSKNWAATLSKYNLTVSQKAKDAILNGLQKCQ